TPMPAVGAPTRRVSPFNATLEPAWSMLIAVAGTNVSCSSQIGLPSVGVPVATSHDGGDDAAANSREGVDPLRPRAAPPSSCTSSPGASQAGSVAVHAESARPTPN